MRCKAEQEGRRRHERERSASSRALKIGKVTAMTLWAVLMLAPLRAQAPVGDRVVDEVRISGPDGSIVVGRYRDAGRGSRGVLLFPMCSPSGLNGWSPVADRLRVAGVSSLMLPLPLGTMSERQARADAAMAYLQSRLDESAPIAPEWARALREASANPASRVELWTPRIHGTDYFAVEPSLAGQIADWLVERLRGRVPSPAKQ